MKASTIKICMGSSCFSRGNRENLVLIQQYINDNNLDSKVEITGNLCTGACSEGPHIFFNNDLVSNVSPELLPDLLKNFFGQIK